MLLDNEEEASRPDNVELVGVVTAPVGTHVLNVYDPLLDERYPLGYQLGVVFPNTTQPNWAELALKHRENIEGELAAERAEQEGEDRAEAERLADAEREKLELAEILAMPVNRSSLPPTKRFCIVYTRPMPTPIGLCSHAKAVCQTARRRSPSTIRTSSARRLPNRLNASEPSSVTVRTDSLNVCVS